MINSLENNIVIKPHSRKIITEAEKLDIHIKTNWINDFSPKRKLVQWVTIDWFWTRIRDDLVYAEKTKNWYSIFISIIDTSEIIDKDSLLDIEASKLIRAKYFATHSYPLFPEILSIGELSLNDKTYRKTQTTRIDYDNDYNPVSSEMFESISYNLKAFNYFDFEKEYKNPDSSNYKLLKLLAKIANWIKQKRTWRSDVNYNESIALNLDKLNSKDLKSLWQEIVSEFSIAKKIEDAKIAYKKKINLIFKWHKPELKNKITWNIEWFGSFHTYKPTFHYWMQESFFTTTTSPTRLYSDLVNQRQQKAKIRKDIEPYSINEIRKICFNINTQTENIVNYQKDYDEEIFIKRVKRKLKKLSYDNFENIWTLPENMFHNLIKYFINYDSSYFNNSKIAFELIYRIQNNFLNIRTIKMINSIPKIRKEADLFKELIRNNY